MTIKRTDIRSAFATLLTGLTTTGSRVYKTRTLPLGATELPAILVFSGEDVPESTLLSTNAPITRRLELRADIMTKEAAGSEDTADKILSEMETAIFASTAANTLSGKVSGLRLKVVGSPDIDDTTDKPVLRLPVLFEAIYTA